MTAIACLRVDVSAHQDMMPAAALGPLVQKFAGAYLETRWSWPRRFFSLTEFSFLLTDPRSDELDVEELRRLSDELQRHLFGDSDEGEVALLVFEGTHAAVTAFAALDAQAVAAAVADPALLPEGGRLTRIVAGERPAAPAAPEPPHEHGGGPEWAVATGRVRSTSPEWALVTGRSRATTEGPPPSTAWEGAQGVYFAPREVFFGDVPAYIPTDGKTHLSLLDGAEHRPQDPRAFDTACVAIAARMLAARGSKGALIYVPVSFDSLMRPSLRSAYEAMFAALPAGRRAELAVAVYDVPRDPIFTGLKQARAFLDTWFSVVDLGVADPGFEIEKLPPEVATSVTLTLPDGDAHVRLSVLRRFAERLVHYKQRRIWPGVANIRRRAELEAAVRLRIPFLTGPGICTPVPATVGGRGMPIDQLPMALGEWMDLHDQKKAEAQPPSRPADDARARA